MGLLKEFREFAVRGNVIDMAVGVIIGAAFGKIVSSLVADVIMPPVGAMLGGMDFASLSITIKQAVADKPAVLLNYGKFIQTIIDFLIIAFTIFMAVKAMNKAKSVFEKEKAEEAAPAKDETLETLKEIRDLLKK